jgi:predicted Rossmann fold flavoprotein
MGPHHNNGLNVAVIGGGAAGHFAALSAKAHHRAARVTIIEKSDKVLAKVRISGGGRCNVTNATFTASGLSKNYPRGGKPLKKAFARFQATDTVAWFAERGVELKTEPDGRMFPTTDSSATIIDCLSGEAQKAGIALRLSTPVRELAPSPDGGWLVNGDRFDKVIVAAGGSPKAAGFAWLEQLGHEIVPPVPSLFTFNMPDEPAIRALMGVVVPDAQVRIQGTRLTEQGPVLVTHWGLSGPAILRLSAWGARTLAEKSYNFAAQINWSPTLSPNQPAAEALLDEAWPEIRRKKIANACPWSLPRKFWAYLLERAGVDGERPWMDLGKKQRNKLIDTVLNDVYEVRGKTTFKEEFVTCGGVALSEVDFKTMESRRAPGLYFAGEVLNVDGITGGFNFQAAWTTGFIAGQLA